MYITNPTEKQLENWKKTSNKTGRYVVDHFGVSPIHRTKTNYYFSKTSGFLDAYKKIPIWIKIFEIF